MLIKQDARKLSRESRPPQRGICVRSLRKMQEHATVLWGSQGMIVSHPCNQRYPHEVGAFNPGQNMAEWGGGGWAWRILPRASMSTSGTNKRAISLISSTFCRDIINTIMAWVWGPGGDTLSSCPEWIAHQVPYLLCFLLLSPIISYSSLLSLLLSLVDEWTPDSS